MSNSLKHVVKRRVHLERSQPQHRKKKYSILEKHSDYVLRARDFHKKRKIIQNLREKARTRNPDEFYFKMIHSRLDEHGRYEKVSHQTQEELKKEKRNLNSGNRNLVKLKKQIDLKGAEKTKENLHIVGLNKPKNHVLYMYEDSDQDIDNIQSQIQKDNAENMERLAGRIGIEAVKKQNKLSITQLSKRSIDAAVEVAESMTKQLASVYQSVVEKKNHVKKLDHALELLERQKNLSTKEHVKVIKGTDGERNIHVWKTSRKR